MKTNQPFDLCQMSTVYSVLSDDDEDHQSLLIEGQKAEVFETLQQYVPATVRVLEYFGPEGDRDLIATLNGEEWLRENNCPTCGK